MLEILLEIALDLCANLAAEDRYRRLVHAVRRIIPCDSIAVLRLEQGQLIPVAMEGLVPEATGRRFDPREHPRLARTLEARGPVRFTDSRLPIPSMAWSRAAARSTPSTPASAARSSSSATSSARSRSTPSTRPPSITSLLAVTVGHLWAGRRAAMRAEAAGVAAAAA